MVIVLLKPPFSSGLFQPAMLDDTGRYSKSPAGGNCDDTGSNLSSAPGYKNASGTSSEEK